MKKIISVILAAVLSLSLIALTARGGSSSDSDTIKIAVPNDTTNEARALLLLENLGYIEHRRGKHQRDQHLYLFLPHTG